MTKNVWNWRRDFPYLTDEEFGRASRWVRLQYARYGVIYKIETYFNKEKRKLIKEKNKEDGILKIKKYFEEKNKEKILKEVKCWCGSNGRTNFC